MCDTQSRGDGESETDERMMAADEVGFAPERVASGVRGPFDLAPSTASCLVREFTTCPECGAGFDPDVTDAKSEDRDVVWADRTRPRAAPHECAECGGVFEVLVEEKAVGVIGREQVPDDPAECLHFVDCENGGDVLFVNTFQIFVSPVRSGAETEVSA